MESIMSTRSTAHFFLGNADKPDAIIYRHADGYPDGAGSDILAFLKELHENVEDNRLDDPSYLSAKYVVFLARLFNIGYRGEVKSSPLDFISVGIMNEDPGDIEYRYEIRCQGRGELPIVKCFKMTSKADGSVIKGKAVRIPAPKSGDTRRDAALKTPMSQAMEIKDDAPATTPLLAKVRADVAL